MRKSVPAKIRKEVMIVGEVMEAGPEFSQGKGRKGRRARRRVGEVQERDTRWRQRAREHALRPPTPTGGFQSFWEAPWEI